MKKYLRLSHARIVSQTVFFGLFVSHGPVA